MKIPKGLKISQVRPGTGRVAEPGKFALIHYDCYLPRGEKCESSRSRGPVQLRVGERLTYPALAYGLPGMAVGEVRMVRVSPNLTYYERKQNPKLPPGVALRYEIELLSVNDEAVKYAWFPNND
jgi:FKBP-type peptidyl-prolyl cis-trans isomerase